MMHPGPGSMRSGMVGPSLVGAEGGHGVASLFCPSRQIIKRDFLRLPLYLQSLVKKHAQKLDCSWIDSNLAQPKRGPPQPHHLPREDCDISFRRSSEGVGDDLVDVGHFITPASCASSAPARSRRAPVALALM